ncbi:MAG TPA: hypothetical protein VG940_02370 [Gemmatimonadales bacterium]|nr:hypothetical protein [Gemmatimonadales bacterium]
MKRVLVSALLGASLVATAAQAQDRYEEVVRSELRRVGQTSENSGYHLTTDIFMGRLDDDATTNQNVTLQAGQDYAIWGVCDQDCSDIDLTLYDDDGNQIDQDIQTDDKPLVRVTPRRNGRFRIRVSMANCSANPCRYGVGVWARNSRGGNSDNSGNSGDSGDGDRWERVVRQQLDNAGRVATDRGYQMSHEVFMGRLDDDQNESLNIPLDGGTQYILVGVCDQDCTDVDLTIYDPDGNEVDSDLETDDKPVLQLTARNNGRYRVKVSMVACSANPCRYGVGVWAK